LIQFSSLVASSPLFLGIFAMHYLVVYPGTSCQRDLHPSGKEPFGQISHLHARIEEGFFPGVGLPAQLGPVLVEPEGLVALKGAEVMGFGKCHGRLLFLGIRISSDYSTS